MSVAPDPAEIFDRAAQEGERRLDQSLLELVATSFIAGFTVVFGVVALALVHASVVTEFGDVAHVAGSLAFGTGMVFLIVGRTELFNENFFDPVAFLVDEPSVGTVWRLLRLWAVTFALNLVGGGIFVAVLSVEGAIPPGAAESVRAFAEEFVERPNTAGFAKGIAGGTLVSLLSYLLQAVNSIRGRITLAYAVGFLLALGPFDHVVVTILHVLFGLFSGASITMGALATTTAVVTAGNLVGGLGLVTLAHVAQVIGARQDDG